MFETILYCEYNKVRDAFATYYRNPCRNPFEDNIVLEEFEEWVTENDAWNDHFWVCAEDCYPASAFTNFALDFMEAGAEFSRGGASILAKFGGRPK